MNVNCNLALETSIIQTFEFISQFHDIFDDFLAISLFA